jgi:hypothetical protein
MNLVASIFLAMLFLGLPFYWGAFGHNGLAVPMIWALAVALAVTLRGREDFEPRMVPSILVTFAVSLAVCAAAFTIGRALSR